MEPGLKTAFISVIMRFKRIDACYAFKTNDVQFSELAILGKASAGCACTEKGVSVSEIGQALYLSKPAISQTLNNLEKKGYIIREIDRQDRRKILVTLTAEGNEKLKEDRHCFDLELNKALERFGTANTKKLIQLLDCLMDILDEQQ